MDTEQILIFHHVDFFSEHFSAFILNKKRSESLHRGGFNMESFLSH